ncbi:MAG TPA: mechanosensitive ion channel family protein [Bacteroidales bacterium]|nr:mechanosensitive ion channel family protein [Bacteroidales bacterium]
MKYISDIEQFITNLFSNSTVLKYTLLIIFIYGFAFILTRILRFSLKSYFNYSSEKLNVDPTKFNFLRNALSFIIFLIATIIVFVLIPELKALGLTLTAGAGIITAVFAFASQQAFANIIGGLFIVIFKPFRVNDMIKIGTDYMGTVEDITLRHTVIRNFENRRVIVPNSVISSETIINSNIVEDKVCNFVEVGISYDSDVDKAMAIMQEEAMKHPNFIDNRSDQDKEDGIPPVVVRILGFGESSVNLRAWVWALDSGKGFVMRTDLYKSIKKRFDEEGIEIPFPYRTVVFKKDLENGKN